MKYEEYEKYQRYQKNELEVGDLVEVDMPSKLSDFARVVGLNPFEFPNSAWIRYIDDPMQRHYLVSKQYLTIVPEWSDG